MHVQIMRFAQRLLIVLLVPFAITTLSGCSSSTLMAVSTLTNSGPTKVTGGAIHVGDPTATSAQPDLTTTYKALERMRPSHAQVDICGVVIPCGLFKVPVSLAITGNPMLDAQHDPNSDVIFQTAPVSTLTNSTVALINRAKASKVFRRVGSSATLATRTGR